jgi:hypothetical protein
MEASVVVHGSARYARLCSLHPHISSDRIGQCLLVLCGFALAEEKTPTSTP